MRSVHGPASGGCSATCGDGASRGATLQCPPAPGRAQASRASPNQVRLHRASQTTAESARDAPPACAVVSNDAPPVLTPPSLHSCARPPPRRRRHRRRRSHLISELDRPSYLVLATSPGDSSPSHSRSSAPINETDGERIVRINRSVFRSFVCSILLFAHIFFCLPLPIPQSPRATVFAEGASARLRRRAVPPVHGPKRRAHRNGGRGAHSGSVAGARLECRGALSVAAGASRRRRAGDVARARRACTPPPHRRGCATPCIPSRRATSLRRRRSCRNTLSATPTPSR